MPEIGDVMRGNSIGKVNNQKYIWMDCKLCHRERWVVMKNGKPMRLYCKCFHFRTNNPNTGNWIGEKNPRWKGGIKYIKKIKLPFSIEQIAERFWSNVEKGEKCWIWIGLKNIHGYGRISITRDGCKTRAEKAHRIAYELKYEAFDPKMDVLHKCDIPACVNPEHLFLGTAKDNALDMVVKGRCNPPMLRGEAIGVSKLREYEVIEIKKRLIRGESDSNIAKDFGVCKNTIRWIKTGGTWGWLKI